MTITAFFLRIIRRVPFLANFSHSLVIKKVTTEKPRKKLNNWYNRLNFDEKAIFQNLFCKIFREKKVEISDGFWIVTFRGKELKMPLRNQNIWLDWDNALSIIGHDPDVKSTYENLLNNDTGIKTFFDIGANYGTHSLLFLSQGITTVSFEPNPGLKKEFEFLCDVNDLRGSMESCAIGDRKGTVNLWFPSDATWLGTIVDTEADLLKENFKLEKIEAPLSTLDEYVRSNGIQPDLIKIDTEGNEINVLKGATEVIKSGIPLIIFESNNPKGRNDIRIFFQEMGYTIYDLPFGKGMDNKALTAESFLDNSSVNFIAVPEKYDL